jgi:hypothetical protein
MPKVRSAKRIYKIIDYEPGTGLATKQWKRLKEDIWKGDINEHNITSAELIRAIKSYYFDNIE